ncbi:MAG: endonuclease [Bacilli bacterium]
MKKIILLSSLLPLLLCSFSSLPRSASSFQGKAFDSTQKLDLTDSTTSEIDSYYGNIGSDTGAEIIKELYDVISVDNTYVTYSKVTDWYKITDRNWSLSQEVNPDTYKFTSDSQDNFYETMLYFNDNTDKAKAINTNLNGYGTDSSLDHIDWENKKLPNNSIQVDKEHVWVKSHGFSPSGDPFSGAGTDLHHLIAADHMTNNLHNDNYYGVVADHSTAKETYCYYADGTKELSGWIGNTALGEKAFEPTDKWKGDVARALFYMATRFSNKLDLNTEAEPYLLLTDDISLTDDNSIYHGVFHNLSDFMNWNESDPVDDYEKHRNNLIYKNVQNNRNPYVDHPEWVRRAFDSNFSDFGLSQDYDLHLPDTLKLDLPISTNKENSRFTFLSADYDNTIISLDDTKTIITPIKAGKTDLTYHVTDTQDNEEKTFTTHLVIGDSVKVNGLTDTEGNLTFTMNQNGSYQMSVSATNMLPTESLTYESQDNTIATVSSTGLINGVSVGTTAVSVYLSGNNEKKLLATVNVTVNEDKSKQYIMYIVIAAVILVVILVIFVSIVHGTNKKGRRKNIVPSYKALTKKKKTSKKRK